MMTARNAIPLGVLAAAACSWGEPVRPLIHGVSPDRISRGTAAVLSVSGEFEPGVTVDFDEPVDSRVCRAVRVELRAAGQAPVPLPDARAVSKTEIRARLTADLQDVRWDLVVDTAGGVAVLPGALEVTSCSSTPNAPCDDGNPCTFDADVLDPAPGLEDQCTGVAACRGPYLRADGSPCQVECTDGGPRLAGACSAGVCVPTSGPCSPPPTCSTP
jgi:hypothetical protein